MTEATATGINWQRSPVEMVEAVLRAQWPRIASSYRNRLFELLADTKVQPAGKAVKTTTFPQLAALLALKISPLLKRLVPVQDQHTWTTASNAIERALTLRDFLAKGSDHLAGSTAISGKDIQRLMRLYDVSIVDLAARMNITQKRVRYVRTHGVQGKAYCLDWYESITQTGLYTPK